MKSIPLFTLPLLFAAAFSSCKDRAGDYDVNPVTPGPGATADPAAGVYDAPAAYEDGAGAPVPTAPETIAPNAVEPVAPTVPAVAAVAPTAPANGAAILHTVVKGDTLSGISSKYKVPVASIKAANRMTSDVVVLGRKMVIPPR